MHTDPTPMGSINLLRVRLIPLSTLTPRYEGAGNDNKGWNQRVWTYW